MRPTSQVASSKVHMSAVVDEVMDKLKAMTLLEASELVKAIEETFDVDASAGGGGGMMMMAPGGGAAAGGAAEAAEEKTEFDIVLESFPADKKIAVLKVCRSVIECESLSPLGMVGHARMLWDVDVACQADVSSRADSDTGLSRLGMP